MCVCVCVRVCVCVCARVVASLLSRIMSSSVTCPVPPYVSMLSHKRKDTAGGGDY